MAPAPADVTSLLNKLAAGDQEARDDVEGLEALVHRNLDDGGPRIDRAVHGAHALAVPAATSLVGAFAAIPGRAVCRRIEAPGHEVRAAERCRKRRHT